MIEIALEAGEEHADIFWAAEIGDGIGDGVLIFEAQQRRELLRIQLLDAHRHIMREDKIQKGLLLGGKLLCDQNLGVCGAHIARERGRA